jgi:tetratricopeptide (TPR) repeat protein
MLAWPAMEGGVPRVGVLVVTVAAGALALAAMVAGGGSGFGGLLRVGGAAVLALAVLLVLFGLRVVPLPRLGGSGLALAATTVLLAVWTGATIGWSIVPDTSWQFFNRTVVFAVFLGLGLVLAGVGERLAARLGAWALAVCIAVVLSWALAAKAIPALDSSGDTIARLHVPVDYWNALALLADAGLVISLWLGALRRRTTWMRVAGALLAYGATLALLLTQSRAGLAAAVVAVALWLVLSRHDRVAGGLFLVATILPAAAVGGWAYTRPALVQAGATHGERVADGAVFGVLAVVGAGVAAGLVFLGSRRRLDEASRQKVGRGLLGTLAAGIVVGLVALVVAVGNPVTKAWDQVTAPCSQLENNPGRITSLNPNSRLCWWTEAWRVFAGKVPLGAGAGSFEVARKRYRKNAASVRQPHSIPLQQLSDGGVVAFLLFLGLAVSAGAACTCAVRRLEGEERAAAIALLGLPVAYGVHALVDYDWDFLAVTAPTMLALGVLAGAGRPLVAVRSRPLVAVAGALVALSVLASVSFPRLAERSNRSAIAAIDSGDLARAKDDASRARFFDPLSVDSLYTLAGVASRQGREREALARYVQAVDLQPENPDTWYALGSYEFLTGNLCAAYRYLNHSYTLDPAGSQWVKGGDLDQARAAVNSGACK